MSDSDQLLTNYIKTLADRELGFHDPEPLTDEQLRDIALNTGMSEAEWEASLKTAGAYYENGRTFNNQRNWPDAIEALSKAVSIYPNHTEALYELANAWLKQGMQANDSAAFERYELYLNFLLKRVPTHAGALALQTEEHQWKTRTTNLEEINSGTRKRWLGIAVAAIVLIGGITHISISSSMSSEAENVRSAWAQVENVYQRKANLIPQLIEVVKAQANVQQPQLQELQQLATEAQALKPLAANELPEEELMTSYASHYEGKFRQAVTSTMSAAAQTPGFSASGQFLDLQTQIEGAENRISVERKRYNEAVEAYNRKASGFPTSLYGYEPLPYYHGTAP